MSFNEKIKSLYSAIGLLVIRVFLLLWGIITIFPLIWTAYSSLKSNKDLMADPWGLPKELHWENYIYAWETSEMYRYFLNSVLIVVGTLILTLVMATTSAYIIAKYQSRIIRTTEKFYIIFMMVPQVLLLVPLYFQCMKWNMVNSLPSLVLLYSLQGLPFTIFIFVGYMKGIHNSFIEAAIVDGASEFRVFSSVIIPMCKPSIFIASLMSIAGSWNEYTMALTFIREKVKYTVPIGISYLSNSSAYRTEYGGLFAGLVTAMIPILIIYAIFQKPLQEGMAASDGLKG